VKRYLEPAKSGRATCTVCRSRIARGEIRVAEETFEHDLVKTRFSHLACAIELHRDLAHDAIASRDTADELVLAVLPQIAGIDAKLADEVRTIRARRGQVSRGAMPLDDDARTRELLGQLETAPDDRGLYGVLADHLQQRGDPRGELIALDLLGSLEETALARRRQLAAGLAPPLDRGISYRPRWGIGFLRTLELSTLPTTNQLRTLLAHPSCRLLEALVIRPIVVHEQTTLLLPTGVLPRSLRTLVLEGGLEAGSDLSTLPNLDHVRLAHFAELAHPTLASLTLSRPAPDVFERCRAEQLPGLTRLVVAGYHEPDLVRSIVRTGLLGQLSELELELVSLELPELALLEEGLGGRRLSRLVLDYCGWTALERPRLAALCDTLVFDDRGATVAGPIYIEHASKPEWGRGTVVREGDGKVVVAFDSGTRTFKSDAPFLRRFR
jgi:uncharacterized protein (TIGR02996 family)